MKRTESVVIILTLAVVGLAGCSPEPRTATMHEPGVYKGRRDPLLAMQKQQELVDRLRSGQKDR